MHNFIYIISIVAGLYLLRICSKKSSRDGLLLTVGVACVVAVLSLYHCKMYNATYVAYEGDYLLRVRRFGSYMHGNDAAKGVFELKRSTGDNYKITSQGYGACVDFWGETAKMTRTRQRSGGRRKRTRRSTIYTWDQTPETTLPMTIERRYRSGMVAANSMFDQGSIPDEVRGKLFDYPMLDDVGYIGVEGGAAPDENGVKRLAVGHQETVLGLDDDNFKYKMSRLNGVFGAKNRPRTYLLFFEDKPAEYGEYQKTYWRGGNLNELVVCIGYSSVTGRIEWCNTFSWEVEPYVAPRVRQWFERNNSMERYGQFIEWYEALLSSEKTKWQTKLPAEFGCWRVGLTIGQICLVALMTFVATLLMGLWVADRERYHGAIVLRSITLRGAYDELSRTSILLIFVMAILYWAVYRFYFAVGGANNYDFDRAQVCELSVTILIMISSALYFRDESAAANVKAYAEGERERRHRRLLLIFCIQQVVIVAMGIVMGIDVFAVVCFTSLLFSYTTYSKVRAKFYSAPDGSDGGKGKSKSVE
ncbi:MAG: hypothetical protein SNH79_05620 [Rikenellaceae bacterium]